MKRIYIYFFVALICTIIFEQYSCAISENQICTEINLAHNHFEKGQHNDIHDFIVSDINSQDVNNEQKSKINLPNYNFTLQKYLPFIWQPPKNLL